MSPRARRPRWADTADPIPCRACGRLFAPRTPRSAYCRGQVLEADAAGELRAIANPDCPSAPGYRPPRKFSHCVVCDADLKDKHRQAKYCEARCRREGARIRAILDGRLSTGGYRSVAARLAVSGNRAGSAVARLTGSFMDSRAPAGTPRTP